MECHYVPPGLEISELKRSSHLSPKVLGTQAWFHTSRWTFKCFHQSFVFQLLQWTYSSLTLFTSRFEIKSCSTFVASSHCNLVSQEGVIQAIQAISPLSLLSSWLQAPARTPGTLWDEVSPSCQLELWLRDAPSRLMRSTVPSLRFIFFYWFVQCFYLWDTQSCLLWSGARKTTDDYKRTESR